MDRNRKYAYADNGNLTEKIKYNTATGAMDTWSYTYSNHAVTAINSSREGNKFSFTYDATGNMTEKRDLIAGKTKKMQYDSNNRIEEVTDTSGKVLGQYDYDDQGFRVKKRAKRTGDTGEQTVEVIYPSMYFGMERELEPDGSVTGSTTYSVNNIYLNGVRIAALTATGETRYYLTDQVDSVSMVVSEQGKPLTSFEYMPYGETWLERVAPNLKEKHNPKYNSQELDPETDFYYYNARYYDPEVSRFVTADTVIDGEGTVFGWNRYMYVKGNPITHSDPTGYEDIVMIKLSNPKIPRLESEALVYKNDTFKSDSFKALKGYEKLMDSANIFGKKNYSLSKGEVEAFLGKPDASFGNFSTLPDKPKNQELYGTVQSGKTYSYTSHPFGKNNIAFALTDPDLGKGGHGKVPQDSKYGEPLGMNPSHLDRKPAYLIGSHLHRAWWKSDENKWGGSKGCLIQKGFEEEKGMGTHLMKSPTGKTGNVIVFR